MVDTRTTADRGLDAAGVTDRIHRSSSSLAAFPGQAQTSYMVVVVMVLS